jgi:uncharacterized protein (DUF433 family)
MKAKRDMNRQEEFEMQLEELIKEFSDLSYGQLVESLEYYADRCRRKGEI